MAGDAEHRAQRAAQHAAERVARKLRDISDQARIPRSQGLVLPVLDDDPAADDPTNMWMFADGRIRVRKPDGTVEDFLPAGYGGSTGTGTSDTPKPPDPKIVKKVETYSATWGRTLCPVHGAEQGASLYYGRFDARHGQRKVMLGLDEAQIQADLAGATIRAVEVHFRNDWAYSHAGVDIKLGGHKKASPPASYSSVREAVLKGHWPKSGEGKFWRPAPVWFGEALRDDTIHGLTINQRSDASVAYGAMAWATFKIRITFTVEV